MGIDLNRLKEVHLLKSNGATWESLGGEPVKSFYHRNKHYLRNIESELEIVDKKSPDVHWREYLDHATATQELRKKASCNQSGLTINKSGFSDLDFICLGDLHFFASGTDHRAIVELTDRILSHDNLYLVLLGDELETAINMRNVAEVTSQLMPPAIQLKVFESWLNEVKDRVLFATWDNHSSERFEKGAGVDMLGWIKSKSVPFFDSIGNATIKVGSQEYFLAATHKLRGKSSINPMAGHARYMRFDDPTREIVIAGDSHVCGSGWWYDGGIKRMGVNCGTMNVNSPYAKRYFSLYAQPVFPVVTLYGKEHNFTAVESLKEWEMYRGL